MACYGYTAIGNGGKRDMTKSSVMMLRPPEARFEGDAVGTKSVTHVPQDRPTGAGYIYTCRLRQLGKVAPSASARINIMTSLPRKPMTYGVYYIQGNI